MLFCVIVLTACKKQFFNFSFVFFFRIIVFFFSSKKKSTYRFFISIVLIIMKLFNDWIKIVFLIFDYDQIIQSIFNVLIDVSRFVDKFIVVHVIVYDIVRQTFFVFDFQLYHVSIDRVVNDVFVQRFLNDNQFICFIFTTMRIIVCVNSYEKYNYNVAIVNVTTLYNVQMSIFANSNAYEMIELSFQIAFDDFLHLNLLLLMKTKLNVVNALRTTTMLSIKYYKLIDRKNVKIETKIDLLLIKCDSIMNITCSKNIKRIWIAKMKHEIEKKLKNLNLSTDNVI